MAREVVVVVGRSEKLATLAALGAFLASGPAGEPPLSTVRVVQNRRSSVDGNRRRRPAARYEDRRKQLSAGGGDRRSPTLEIYPVRVVVRTE